MHITDFSRMKGTKKGSQHLILGGDKFFFFRYQTYTRCLYLSRALHAPCVMCIVLHSMGSKKKKTRNITYFLAVLLLLLLLDRCWPGIVLVSFVFSAWDNFSIVDTINLICFLSILFMFSLPMSFILLILFYASSSALLRQPAFVRTQNSKHLERLEWLFRSQRKAFVVAEKWLEVSLKTTFEWKLEKNWFHNISDEASRTNDMWTCAERRKRRVCFKILQIWNDLIDFHDGKYD